MALLHMVAQLNLPDWYIAAGFVRNMVWDDLHGYPPTALNDVDVIYFDAQQSTTDSELEGQLSTFAPHMHWQVRNQATMHTRNQDPPYLNSLDAMRYWPELETAVGVKLTPEGDLELAAPFGIQTLLAGIITHNPRRQRDVFDQRVASKGWLSHWPRLRLATSDSL